MDIIYFGKVFIELLPALGLGRIDFWQHMETFLRILGVDYSFGHFAFCRLG